MTFRGWGCMPALGLILFIAGCSSAGSTAACRCPTPVTYNDATIKKITQALRALPADNILHQTMDDYEDERDDLRACLGIPD